MHFSCALVCVSLLVLSRAQHSNSSYTSSWISSDSNATASCPLSSDTIFAVYTDVSGGVGNGSSHWEVNFWSWWHAQDSRVDWVSLNKEHIGGVKPLCVLSDYPSLRMYVQPGGDAYGEQVALGKKGAKNINDFIDSRVDRKYMGTCAGWYFAADSYWWQGKHYAFPTEPSLLNRFPTIEGSIYDIQNYDDYPCYAVTEMDNGLHAVYYGGPTLGWHHTKNVLPKGAKQLMGFKELPGNLPSAVQTEDMLLWSVHLEAYAGSFDVHDGKPVLITLDDADRLRNYQFRARSINDFLGTDFRTD